MNKTVFKFMFSINFDTTKNILSYLLYIHRIPKDFVLYVGSYQIKINENQIPKNIIMNSINSNYPRFLITFAAFMCFVYMTSDTVFYTNDIHA